MKHLKLFENTGDIFWIVVYERLEDTSSNFQALFDDKESAENYYIELINDLKTSKIWYKKKRNLNPDEMVLTVEDADEWVNDNYDTYKVTCKEIQSKGKHPLRKDIQEARIERGFNL